MRYSKITMRLGAEPREFVSVEPLMVVDAMMRDATFFEGEGVREYAEWVAGNLLRTAGIEIDPKGADDATLAESFLLELQRIDQATLILEVPDAK